MKDYQTSQRKKDLKLSYAGPMATSVQLPYFPGEQVVRDDLEREAHKAYLKGMAIHKASL